MDQKENSLPGLIVIAGATATGKSTLAIALAQRLKTMILTADSRQVYREFDIGTAKPSMQERQQVPHYLLDLCDPRATFTLADYQQQAQQLIGECHQRGQTPLLVGGTGLYIQSITEGLIIPRVAPQLELRSQLMQVGQSQIYQWLQQVDPASAAKIHPNDQVRTLRALEVFYVSGQPLSAQQGRRLPTYPILYIGLESDRLEQRIRQRTEQMLAAGWLEEVKRIIAAYGWDLPLLNTLGYRDLKDFLQGGITFPETQERIVLHTRQFAKQQRTWFRGVPGFVWFDADDPEALTKVEQLVFHFLHTETTKA